MRTRRVSYPSATDGITFCIAPRPPKRMCYGLRKTSHAQSGRKRSTSDERHQIRSMFDVLPDDLLISIFAAVSSSAKTPADLLNTMLTCKRFCAAARKAEVLANASMSALAVGACTWSEGAQRFLKKCADAGNTEACYTLGMIRFYCLQNRCSGSSLMAKAAMASHSAALHSLAIIQFNGSGGIRKDKDLKAGVALCARAATLGHVDAMRELGHCLQDGYGVARNVREGRRLLLEANAREAAAAVAATTQRFAESVMREPETSACMRCFHHHLQYYSDLNKANFTQKLSINLIGVPASTSSHHCQYRVLPVGGCDLLSDFGFNLPPVTVHVANQFLLDWFTLYPPQAGLRLCSHGNCGRLETRRHEFRRCSACAMVNYCSRACQALDWKIRHKDICTPIPNWEDLEGNRVENTDLGFVNRIYGS
ncbi:hypothetical protein O6H91_02G093700 [Diphasiastrum complanatum]|uniref:Uncharacterized protein n=1 Tax=Diphasiastrum complanatum TaxID=34168 RepID=A0ACC2EIJ0_DIPCM|nr:hypothetical protein O6H91_02G093700 [Diphasiastrum complanatum]